MLKLHTDTIVENQRVIELRSLVIISQTETPYRQDKRTKARED